MRESSDREEKKEGRKRERQDLENFQKDGKVIRRGKQNKKISLFSFFDFFFLSCYTPVIFQLFHNAIKLSKHKKLN